MIINLSNLILFAVLAAGFIIGHIQNDLINPSFPDMMRYFSTTPKIFHLMSSACIFGTAIAGIFFGPLSDFYGRKKMLQIGIAFILLGQIGSIISSSIYFLIFSRFIMGIGIAAPVIICVSLVFDSFDKKASSSLTGIYDGIITTSKSASPIIGSYINIYYGWRACFATLFLITFIVLIFNYFYLKEPLRMESKKENFKFKFLLQNYLLLLKSKIFMLKVIKLALMGCSLAIYLTSISLIFTDYMNVPKHLYGFYISFIMASFAFFSFSTAIIVKYLGINNAKKIGLIMISVGVSFLLFTAFMLPLPILITLSMSICSGGFAILIPLYIYSAMSVMPELKGYSSSLIAFTRLILVSIGIAIAGYFFNGTIKPLAIIVFLIVVTILFIEKKNASNQI